MNEFVRCKTLERLLFVEAQLNNVDGKVAVPLDDPRRFCCFLTWTLVTLSTEFQWPQSPPLSNSSRLVED